MSIYAFPPRKCAKCGHAEEKHRPWCIDGKNYRALNNPMRISQQAGWEFCRCKEFTPLASGNPTSSKEAGETPNQICRDGKT